MMRRTGSRLAPSVAIENALYNDIRPVIDAMFGGIDSAIRRERLYDAKEKARAMFAKEGRRITRDFINRVVNHTRRAFHSSTKGFKAKAQDDLHKAKSVRRIDRRWRDCEEAIKSIPEVFFDKVDSAVRLYNEGEITDHAFFNRVGDLKRQTYTRAKLIARNENSGATEDLFLSRCDESKIRLVKWCHSHLSEKPRDYHLRRWDGHSGRRNGKPNGLNGYIFDLSKPPVIDQKTGERGYPAQLANCRCFLVPVEEEP